MRYLGSKFRIFNSFKDIIISGRHPKQYYIEPFVGGCNSMDKVTGYRIGSDNNIYIIEMWKALQRGWTPPDFVSEEEYNYIKTHKEYFPKELVGFVGFGCSFGGKWFAGYARSIDRKGRDVNHAAQSKRSILKQIPNLKDVEFLSGDFTELFIPNNSIVYCDPPYESLTNYRYNKNGKFDHNTFWEWAELLSRKNKVFVSEYNSPEGWTVVWEKEILTPAQHNGTSKYSLEKLFVYNYHSL